MLCLILVICSVPDLCPSANPGSRRQSPADLRTVRVVLQSYFGNLPRTMKSRRRSPRSRRKIRKPASRPPCCSANPATARAVEPLMDLLKDEDPMSRIAAVEALGRLGDNSSVDLMVEMTYTEKDWRVRMAMVGSMLSFKSVDARASVLNGIANPSGEDISDINDLYVRCSAILTCNQLQATLHIRARGSCFCATF